MGDGRLPRHIIVFRLCPFALVEGGFCVFSDATLVLVDSLAGRSMWIGIILPVDICSEAVYFWT